MSKYSIIPSSQLDYEISNYTQQLQALETMQNISSKEKSELRKYYQSEITERKSEIDLRNLHLKGKIEAEKGVPSKNLLNIPVKAEIIKANSV